MSKIYPQAFFGSNIVPIAGAHLSVASAAVLYGLSVYTVLPVCVSKDGLMAFRVDDHFKRLVDSARIIGIDSFEKNWTKEAFLDAIKKTVAVNNITEDVFVRVTVHIDELVPGTRSRGLTTVLSIFIYEAKPIVPQDGARLKVSMWRRVPDYAIPSRAKLNGAYVNSVLGKQDALDSGYDDCIFLDATGHVCELSAANIFMVRNGMLITPGTESDILEGINRRTVLEVAQKLGIQTVERPIDLTELYIADEVFACGTSAFVAYVSEIDKRKIKDGAVGPLTAKLKEKHSEILHGADVAYTHYLTRIT